MGVAKDVQKKVIETQIQFDQNPVNMAMKTDPMLFFAIFLAGFILGAVVVGVFALAVGLRLP